MKNFPNLFHNQIRAFSSFKVPDKYKCLVVQTRIMVISLSTPDVNR